MKYVLLLLLAFTSHAYAVVRLDIDSKQQGKFFLEFPTQKEADEYKREKFNDHHWGQNEREIDKANADDEQLKSALKERTEEIDVFEPDEKGEIKPSKKVVTWLTLPAEYTITETDITKELADAQAVVDARKKEAEALKLLGSKTSLTNAERDKVLLYLLKSKILDN